MIVVLELERLGRSLPEVVGRMQRIAASGAGLRSLKEGFDTRAPEGRVAAGVIGSLALLDRGGRGEWAGAGPAAARVSSRGPGRRPNLTEPRRAAVVNELLSGRQTTAEMVKRYKVSEATVGRVLAAHRVMADAAEGSQPLGDDSRQEEKIGGVMPASGVSERLAIVGTSGSGKPLRPRVWSSASWMGRRSLHPGPARGVVGLARPTRSLRFPPPLPRRGGRRTARGRAADRKHG